jgi:hypothetical protein
MEKRKYLSKRTKEVIKHIPEFMISFNDNLRMRWDLFVIILAIYNCFWIPFEIAFEPAVNFFIVTLNSFIDLIFYIDIVFNLRTTYMTEEGEEITATKKIANRYILHGTFIVDVLSILPLNALTPVILLYITFID